MRGTVRPRTSALRTSRPPRLDKCLANAADEPMRVLVIEDERSLATLIKRGLETEGFSVDLAADGRSGLWAALENSYDVLIVDIMLPVLNGYRLVEALRAKQVWTPVMMLTAKDGEYDQADAFDLGADDYLTKPFSFVVLTARLRSLVRRGAPARPSVLVAGDLSLDPSTRSVVRAGESVRLTSKEFAVLEFLMRRKGDVLSKTSIIENVWDAAFDSDVNIVEVYVGYLRRKIDAPFARHSLQTVRGAGYRLDPDGG